MLIRRIVFLVFLAISATGYSQTKATAAKDPQEPPAGAGKNQLVQVRAVVTDRVGQPVVGLTKEDFLLMEDDVQQPLSFFSMESIQGKSDSLPVLQKDAASPIPGEATGNTGATSSRVLVMLVDTAHVSSNGLERVRKILKQFIDEQKTDQDVVAIMTSAGKPGVKGEFTTDRSKLEAEIKKIRPGYTQFESFLTPALCGKVVRGNPDAVSLAAKVIDSEERTTGSVLTPGPDNPQAEAASKCRMLLLETASRRGRVMAAIETAIEKMSAIPGQPIIALFTDGFSMTAAGGEPAILDIRPVISSAALDGVKIYAFESRVPMAAKQINMESYSLSSEINDSVRDLQHGMSLLASQTGGEAFYNLDGLSEQVQKMLGDNRVCYRLAYYPPSGKDPRKYRIINVSVKDHPEYRVRAQKGYALADSRQSK